jgi:hypothetical protein
MKVGDHIDMVTYHMSPPRRVERRLASKLAPPAQPGRSAAQCIFVRPGVAVQLFDGSHPTIANNTEATCGANHTFSGKLLVSLLACVGHFRHNQTGQGSTSCVEWPARTLKFRSRDSAKPAAAECRDAPGAYQTRQGRTDWLWKCPIQAATRKYDRCSILPC